MSFKQKLLLIQYFTMKKNTIIFGLSILVLFFVSCGQPETDAKKLLSKIEKYTETANKAAEDKRLDEKEIEKLNKLDKELSLFSNEIKAKYKDDKEGKKAYDQYFIDNQKEIGEIYNEFDKAIVQLFECEGNEKLSEIK